MPVHEFTNSPSYGDDGGLERTFIVHGVLDDTEALGVAYAAADEFYAYRVRQRHPSIRKFGHGLWEIVFRYKLPDEQQNDQGQPPDGEPPEGVLEFDTSGATQHITTALEQMHYPPNAPDMKQAIGVGRDTVEGTDVIVPRLTLANTRRPPGIITGEYIKDLARMTGRTNSAPYTIVGRLGSLTGPQVSVQFEAGELRFDGAAPADAGKITYRWEASENATQIEISSGLTVGSKKGHQYLWVKFKNEESRDNLVQVPQFAYVATIYEEADFRAVLGF